MKSILLLLTVFVYLTKSDYLDIGLEYEKLKSVYYWTSPITIQLIFQIPIPTSVDDYKKPRCEYALKSRRSLLNRFRQLFPVVTKVSKYKALCDRFENQTESLYFKDTESDCYKCFHITSNNDPYYLECLTLLELRYLCQKQTVPRVKRSTEDNYIMSNIAVMLAGGQKTQDDRITEKFRKEHNLQKESVNFQLLFLNTFRWQLSLSELWFLHYIQSDPDKFAKILINLSGILPKTRALAAEKINTSISESWTIESTKRNDSHVTVNVTFTSFHPEYQGTLYKFRFFPIRFEYDYFVINSQDTYALRCGKNLVTVSSFDAHVIKKKNYIYDSPCHQIHDTSKLQKCMNLVLKSSENARAMCILAAKKLKQVNNFYFTIDGKIWLPVNSTLTFDCKDSPEILEKVLDSVLILHPKCGCTYISNGRQIPETKTCASKHVFHQIESDYTLWKSFKTEPLFLGQINNDSVDNWHSSSINKLTEENLLKSEMAREYFKKKLEKEKSMSAQFDFKLSFSYAWLILPIFAIILLMVIVYFKCRTNGSFMQIPAPVIINHCNHNQEVVMMRSTGDIENNNSRMVSSKL